MTSRTAAREEVGTPYYLCPKCRTYSASTPTGAPQSRCPWCGHDFTTQEPRLQPEFMVYAPPHPEPSYAALRASHAELLAALELCFARLQHKADTCHNATWKISDQKAYEAAEQAIANAKAVQQ